MIMDRAYEGDETRQLVLSLELEPVVPPKANRLNKWAYDLELYKKRNEVERLFRRLKAFRESSHVSKNLMPCSRPSFTSL